MVFTLGILIGGGTAIRLGSEYGTLISVWSFLQLYCAAFGTIAVSGIIVDKVKNRQLTSSRQKDKKMLRSIANKYNEVTSILESNYRAEKQNTSYFEKSKREQIRQKYEQQYFRNKNSFEREAKLFIGTHTGESPLSKKFKKFWTIVITAGILCNTAGCAYTLGMAGTLSQPHQQATVDTSQLGETTAWNAENVPMPHLTDGSRYVSNPDGIVSDHTETILNQLLKKMDDSLQIESAMIIVNTIEGQDIFRFSQDIFDRYGVGKNDRGLVIVLAYKDHKVRTHTGRSLEADLTDIECSRLQQDYAIPFMKAEQPDSGMLYLTEAIYNTLKGKDLPIADFQKKEAEIDEAFGVCAIYILLLGLWALLIAYIAYRYGKMSTSGLLRANPFAQAPVVIVSGGGFGGGGRSGGFGGFSGGGFSGGSSGGGGATSSW